MTEYFRGDVILAPVTLGGNEQAKVRPAVVVAVKENGILFVCPVSSKAPFDITYTTIDLHDFARGGLDLFEESNVLTANLTTVMAKHVIAKKGRLTEESLITIVSNMDSPLSQEMHR